MINILDYIPLSRKLAGKRYRQFKHRYSYEDLLQTAYVGLIKAAGNFDKDKGTKFLTYAIPYIDGYILKSIRDDKWFLSNRDNRLKTNPPFSLDAVCFENESGKQVTYLDFISTENEIEDDIDLIDLKIAINNLPEKLKTIIQLIYFWGFKQREIGKVLGISQVQVSRLLRKALGILKHQIT